MQDTESQKKKVAIYKAKVEELEQHVGIITNSPEDLIIPEEGDQPGVPYNMNMDDPSNTNDDLWDVKDYS